MLINRPNYQIYCAWCDTSECRMLLIWLIWNVNLFHPQRLWSLESDTSQLAHTYWWKSLQLHMQTLWWLVRPFTHFLSHLSRFGKFLALEWFCVRTLKHYFQVKVSQIRVGITWNLCQVFYCEIQLIPSKKVEFSTSYFFLFRIKAVLCSQVRKRFPSP